MKTPERWRALPRHALFVSILAWKTLLHDISAIQSILSQRYQMMSWRHMMWHDKENLHRSTHQKIWLCDPVTLTFNLWPWPSNVAEIISWSFLTPNFMDLGQTVKPWERWRTDTQTHRQTDATDSIPSTAYAILGSTTTILLTPLVNYLYMSILSLILLLIIIIIYCHMPARRGLQQPARAATRHGARDKNFKRNEPHLWFPSFY